MRILFLIAIATLVGCQTANGVGPVILSPYVQNQFKKYERTTTPQWFAVSMDGRDSGFTYCPVMSCDDHGPGKAIRICQRTAKVECKLYAAGLNVVWDFKAPRPANIKPNVPTFLTQSHDGQSIYCESNAGKVVWSGGGTCKWSGWHEINFERFREKFKAGEFLYHAGTSTTATLPKARPTNLKEQEVASKPRKVPSTSSIQPRNAPFAMEWEGYGSLIAGTIEYRANAREGQLLVVLPSDDGRCTGSYQVGKEGKGTWAVACTNGLNASGTMKTFGPHKGAKGEGTDIKGRKVRFTVGPASN